MRYALSQTLWADNIIPPRCRKPQQARVTFEVAGEILELPADAVRQVATLPDGSSIHHHPATGFLRPHQWSVTELLQHMGDDHQGGYPAESLGQQVEERVINARLKKQAEMDAYVLGGAVLYERTAEPVYLVEFRGSSWGRSTLTLSVAEAPPFTREAYGTDRHDGCMPYCGRFFNATDLAGARHTLAAMMRAYRMEREESRPANIAATDRIQVLDPDVFTFDAPAWHAAAETHRLQDTLLELRHALSRETDLVPHQAPLCPERIQRYGDARTALNALLASLGPVPADEDA